MRVLLIHDRHRSAAPGGEDRVYDCEAALLEAAGHEVVRFERSNDDIDRFTRREKLARTIGTLWSRTDAADITHLIASARPDIAHIHNYWPLVSPSVLWALRRGGVPMVMRLPNFRLFCVNGHLFRDGAHCERCVGRSLTSGVVHRCGGSLTRSAALAGSTTFHHAIGTWGQIDGFVAPSRFARDVALRAGIEASRIFVKPNFSARPARAREGPGEYFLYLGRLYEEKGPDLVVQAMTPELGSLVVAGEGPMRAELAAAASSSASIRFVGSQSPDRCSELLRRARAVVVPSRCRETFGLTVAEAYAHGVPVIAARHGALVESVDDGVTGYLFEPNNVADLREKMQRLLDDALAQSMGTRARSVYEDRFTPERNLELLESVYAEIRARGHPQRTDGRRSTRRRRLTIAK